MHEELRAELAAAAAAKAHQLQRMAELRQVNLFFMAQPGCDVAECVNILCKAGDMRRERDAWAGDSGARLEPLSAGLVNAVLRRDDEAALRGIMASLVLRISQQVPHSEAKPHAVQVRAFAGSVVEDRYVMLPLVLGAIKDNAPTEAQNLAIGTAAVAWGALEKAVSPAHSLWVYLRFSDYAWATRFASSVYTAEAAAACQRYREGMDREFDSPIGAFARTHHTVIVTVNAERMGQADVALDVLCLLCDYVQQLHRDGAWGRLDPSVLQSNEYLRERKLHAEFVKTVDGSASAPAPTGLVSAPLPRTSSSDSSVGQPAPGQRLRTSSSLRRVQPHVDAAVINRG